MSDTCHCSDKSSSSSSSSSFNTSTTEEIKKLCNKCDMDSTKVIYNSRSTRDNCNKSSRGNNRRHTKYDPGVSYFNSVITPLTGLTPSHSGCMGSVEFRMRRKNKTVTLQWEPFTGMLSSSGISYLSVSQSICNTPPYPVSIPIYILYKGIGRVTFINIDPFAQYINIKFYLNTDGSSDNTNTGDNISVPGGCVTWIVN